MKSPFHVDISKMTQQPTNVDKPVYGIPEDGNYSHICGQGILTKILKSTGGIGSGKSGNAGKGGLTPPQKPKTGSRNFKSYMNLNILSRETESTASDELFMDEPRSSNESGGSGEKRVGDTYNSVSSPSIPQFNPKESIDTIFSCDSPPLQQQHTSPNYLRSRSLISWSNSLPSVAEEDDEEGHRRRLSNEGAIPARNRRTPDKPKRPGLEVPIPLHHAYTPDKSLGSLQHPPSPDPFHGIMEDDEDEMLLQESKRNFFAEDPSRKLFHKATSNINETRRRAQQMQRHQLSQSGANASRDTVIRDTMVHSSSPDPYRGRSTQDTLADPFGPYQTDPPKGVGRTMQDLLLQQQLSLKEMSLQNHHYRRELSECQNTFVQLKEERINQQSQLDRLAAEKNTYEAEALYLREQMHAIRQELDALKRQPNSVQEHEPLKCQASSQSMIPSLSNRALMKMQYQYQEQPQKQDRRPPTFGSIVNHQSQRNAYERTHTMNAVRVDQHVGIDENRNMFLDYQHHTFEQPSQAALRAVAGERENQAMRSLNYDINKASSGMYKDRLEALQQNRIRRIENR